jgi:hypothetical protein
MAAHHIQLQFSRLRRLNTFRGKTSYAGRDPINDLFPSNDLFDESAGLSHRSARARREPHAPVFQHDLVEVAASQAVSSEQQWAGHQILTSTESRDWKLETGKWKLENPSVASRHSERSEEAPQCGWEGNCTDSSLRSE